MSFPSIFCLVFSLGLRPYWHPKDTKHCGSLVHPLSQDFRGLLVSPRSLPWSVWWIVEIPSITLRQWWARSSDASAMDSAMEIGSIGDKMWWSGESGLLCTSQGRSHDQNVYFRQDGRIGVAPSINFTRYNFSSPRLKVNRGMHIGQSNCSVIKVFPTEE